MNGAQYLVRRLKDGGVKRVFVLCGNGLNPFLDACLDFKMQVVDVRNEQAAAYMADLTGRFTRRLGVCAVSSGPGHTNALTGLANSWWDGGPMLLISGGSSSDTLGRGHFQEVDQVGMAAPICKHARYIHSVTTLDAELEAALSASLSGRPGPSHLTVPADVLSAEVSEATARHRFHHPLVVEPQGAGDPELVSRAVELLAEAKRPFIIVGSGAFYAQAGGALHRFTGTTHIPILSPIWDRGCVDQPFPQYVGVTTSEVNGAYPLLAKADVVMTIGARVDYRVGYGQPPECAPKVRFIRIDADPTEIGRTVQPDVALVGNPRTVLEQMTEEAGHRGERNHAPWLARVREAHDSSIARWGDWGREREVPVPALRICREVKTVLDETEATFLLDGGNIGRWAHMSMFDRHPSHWMTCGASGVIGWGLPGAIAAKFERPGYPVILLSGDGSAGFTVSEIETALRFKTPYVAVIAHDSAWGIVVDGQAEGRKVASYLGEIRFDRVAEAFGARGIFIEDPDQLGPALRGSIEKDTVTVVHVPTQLGGLGVMEQRRQEPKR